MLQLQRFCVKFCDVFEIMKTKTQMITNCSLSHFYLACIVSGFQSKYGIECVQLAEVLVLGKFDHSICKDSGCRLTRP